MTFIASVVAKNGVAIIADSLVTTSKYSLDYSDFQKYLQNQSNNPNIKIEVEELIKLFRRIPHYTRDYEDKLFQYDDYTAITTAGSASINDKRISKIIEDIVSDNKRQPVYYTIEEKVKHFCKLIEKEIREHLANHSLIFPTSFILTHYDHIRNNIYIYRIKVNPANNDKLEDNAFSFINYSQAYDWETVVCDGQNRISERILYGNLLIEESIITLIDVILTELNYNKEEIPSSFLEKIRNNPLYSKIVYDGIKIDKLRDLSLQQAVELSNLLMRVEIDFQIYTETIPTVGGLIRIAVIDKDKFRFIAGHEITKPQHI